MRKRLFGEITDELGQDHITLSIISSGVWNGEQPVSMDGFEIEDDPLLQSAATIKATLFIFYIYDF